MQYIPSDDAMDCLQNNTILKQNLVYSAMNNTLESNTESEMKKFLVNGKKNH